MIVTRPVTLADEEALARLFSRLSPQSIYSRFFALVHEIDPVALRQLADNDGERRVAIAVEEAGEIVAVARYALDADRFDERTAEVAILVEDAHQGHHLGPELLRELASLARRNGVDRFNATVLGENARALRVFRTVFPGLTATFKDAVFDLDIPLGDGGNAKTSAKD